MHLRHPTHVLLDLDGTAMRGEAVARAALMAARDCMAHDIRAGQLDLSYEIEVQDEAGRIVHVLRFADALTLVAA
jgi:hypothetical protein